MIPDNKELKELQGICGIYLITNLINDKKYVGQSRNIGKRWASHISKSRNIKSDDIEYNKPLYRAMRKYGITNFTFSIVELCDETELEEKEIYWTKYFDSVNSGYNCQYGGNSSYRMFEEQHPNHKLTRADVVEIRTAYANHERCKEVFKRYIDRINWTGFHKIWIGSTWKSVMPEVYTPENITFHTHNTGQKGSENGRSLLTEKQVYDIRSKKKEGKDLKTVYEEYKYTGIKYGSFRNVWNYKNWKNVVVE